MIPVSFTQNRLYSPGNSPLVAERFGNTARISLPSLWDLIQQSQSQEYFPMRKGIPFRLSTLPFRDQSGNLDISRLIQYLATTEQIEKPGMPEIREAMLALASLGIQKPQRYLRR